MDQLRRLQYTEPPEPPPWAPSRMRLRQGRPLDPEIIQSEVKAASVGHPNICKMVDFFEDHEFYYMVMPCFGTGQDLFDFVESAPDGLRADQVRSIFGQVADGLRFLHANQIVHRDVKDENVILDGHGNAQLIDFGSAAHIRPGRLFDTFSGTLDYAAAEILRGEKYGGQEQDVWALGVVGYVLFCGECPFWNGEEAIMGLAPETRAAQALQGRCLIDDGAASSSVGSSDDGGGRLTDAADLISRCLEVDPKDRPTAAQVCEHRFLVGDHGWSGRRGWLRDPTTTTATTSHPAEHADR